MRRPLARVFDIHHCIGQYHLYGDALAGDVEDYARETLALAERNDVARAQAFAWCLLGEALLLHARWDEAAGCLERSCELHASFDGSRSGALPWQRLAELSVSRGEPDEADGLLRRASAIATVSPMAMHMWGRIHATAAFAQLEQGDPEAAARSVRAAAASAVRYGDCPSCSALLNPLAAEAFGALGDLEAARAHAEAATRIAAMFESSAWSAMAESRGRQRRRGRTSPGAGAGPLRGGRLAVRPDRPLLLGRAGAGASVDGVAPGNGQGTPPSYRPPRPFREEAG